MTALTTLTGRCGRSNGNGDETMFIKLTDVADGKSIFINMTHVVAMIWEHRPTYDPPMMVTKLVIDLLEIDRNRMVNIEVSETPEQIMSMINGAQT